MKICWDNLEGVYLGKSRKGRRNLIKNNNAYIEVTCPICNEECLIKKWSKNPRYCSKSCACYGDTHYNPLTDWYNDKRTEKSLERLKSGEWKNWYEYNKLVRQLTEINYRKYSDTINPSNLERGHHKYHIDHIITVKDGFYNNIKPKEIADISNLRMLFCKENHSRRKGSYSNE